MGVQIITDSTADFPAIYEKEVMQVPLTIKFEDGEFHDGVTIMRKEFYTRLETDSEIPTTSQPSPQAFREKYEKAIENGDDAVVLVVASNLSGTYQSAVMAKTGLEDHIFIVDTESATIGAGVLVVYALELAKQGKSAKEIAEILERERKNVTVIAQLDTLENLLKGGRISRGAFTIGKLLSIKAVFLLDNGEIVPVGKARGFQRALNLLTKQIEKGGEIDYSKPFLAGYTGTDDANIQKYLDEHKDIWEGKISRPEVLSISSVIGVHTGSGALGVAFFAKEG